MYYVNKGIDCNKMEVVLKLIGKKDVGFMILKINNVLFVDKDIICRVICFVINNEFNLIIILNGLYAFVLF